jgi:putative ABC transport system permease protein
MKDYLKETENTLRINGMEATVSNEMAFKFKISLGDYGYNSMALQGTGVTADQYRYTKGLPPLYENEVALTHMTADEIGAKIGDTVRIKTGDEEKDFVVTAIYQSMNNLGEGIRFSEMTELDYRYAFSSFAIQVSFEDNPSGKELKKRMDAIGKLFPDYRIYTGGEYVSSMMGNIADQLEGIKQIILLVIITINMLVAVLMVKTFITKEKGEIGMLKSIGFRNLAIIQWQVLRIGIILFVSTILGTLLSNPISQISSGQVFKMMGASHIEFVVKPGEVYFFYPLLIFIMTMVASGLVALQVRRISAQETNNIE